MSTETETPQATLTKATEENVLPRRGMTLIGTMVTENAPTALIRIRRGDIRRVAPGDKLGTALVMAIEPAAVYLTRNGSNERLTLPGA